MAAGTGRMAARHWRRWPTARCQTLPAWARSCNKTQRQIHEQSQLWLLLRSLRIGPEPINASASDVPAPPTAHNLENRLEKLGPPSSFHDGKPDCRGLTESAQRNLFQARLKLSGTSWN